VTLILKRASASRSSGEWDFDVLADGAVVGRVMKAAAAPGRDAVVMDTRPVMANRPAHGLPPGSVLADTQRDRDRGESRDSSPPTPPDVRVRIRRFGGLSRPRHRDGSQAKGPQGASG
jgi:hypothetical protein